MSPQGEGFARALVGGGAPPSEDTEVRQAEPVTVSRLPSRLVPRDESGLPSEAVVPFERPPTERRRSSSPEPRYRVAVLLPCRNEARTIGEVVADFAVALPDAQIWVYDNDSSDETIAVARAAGALIQEESVPGKGQVLRRMFSEIDADIYVIADGDGTYDASAAPRLIAHMVSKRLDMVVGRRRESPTDRDVFRPGHRLGNAVLTGVVQRIFGQGCLDMLSGYRVLSRRYVKSFPASSRGFETETEMTVHALDLGLPFGEVDTLYRERPLDSHSKLRTIPDGLRILKFILVLVKEYRPAVFFGVDGLAVGALALAARFPWFGTLASALSVGAAHTVINGLVVVTAMLFGAGLILDSVSRGRRDVKRMMYLSVSGLPASASDETGSAYPAPGPGVADEYLRSDTHR